MPERRLFAPWWKTRTRERTSKITRGLAVLFAFGLLDVGLVVGYVWAAATR